MNHFRTAADVASIQHVLGSSQPGTGLVYLVLAAAFKLLIAAACRNLTFGTHCLVS